MPPPIDQSRPGMQITVLMSFKRNGELFGQPRITFQSSDASDAERASYRTAVAETLKRCASTGWNYLLMKSRRTLWRRFLVLCRPMTDKARRFAGLLIAPLLIVVGLWLCAEGVLHGKLSNVFWIGPFLAISGGLWLASDWFDF